MDKLGTMIVDLVKEHKTLCVGAVIAVLSDMIFHWHKLFLKGMEEANQRRKERRENYNQYKQVMHRQRNQILREPIYIWEHAGYENREKLYKKCYIKNIPTKLLGHDNRKHIILRKNKGIAILGKAGVGKSTFLRSLFLKQTTGLNLFANRILNRRFYFYKISRFIKESRLMDDLQNGSRQVRGKFIFLDGLDEIGDADYQKMTQLIKKIYEMNFTVVLSCRKDIYEMIKRIEPEIFSLISYHYEIQEWSKKQSGRYIRKYAKLHSESKIEEKIKPYQGNEKYADFFTTPLELSLLIFILEKGNAGTQQCEIANRYDLYDKFLRIWARREIIRNNEEGDASGLKEENVLHLWSTIAFQISKKSDVRGLDMNTQNISQQWSKDKRLKKYVGGIIQVEQKDSGKKIMGFSHLRIMEFLVAYYFFDSIQKQNKQLVDAILFEYTHSITTFIKEKFKIIDHADLGDIFQSLVTILLNMPPYKSQGKLGQYKKTISGEMRNRINALTENERRIIKNQIIYFISRIPNDKNNLLDVGNKVIEVIYNSEQDEYNRRSAAIGATILGNVEIELQYAYELRTSDDCNLRDRSFTMVYYQDVRNKSPFSYIDDCVSNWDNARYYRLERLQSHSEKDLRLRTFDLVTILNFTKSRRESFVPSEQELNIIRNCDIEVQSYDERKRRLLRETKQELLQLWEQLKEL